MSSLLLTGGDLFDGDVYHQDMAVRIEGDTITEVCCAAAARPGADAVIDIEGRLLVPGFVDLQVNGGGGVLFNDAPSVAALQVLVAAHRRFGTTACLPTLITDDADVMEAGITAVREAMEEGVPGIAGIHLEGPHLNPESRGIHDAARMRDLDEQAFQLLCSLGNGKTLVTVAPEVVAAGMIRRLRDAGVIVWGGHSAAGYEETREAIQSGLSGFTHLFNAMPPMATRSPGIVGAALEDQDTFIGVIADGHHVHPAMLAIALRAKPTGKTILVTDAMPTVGSTAEQFTLYGTTITATGGRCVSPDGTLAGSDIGMIDAVKFVASLGVIDLHEALRMASSYPAAALGLDDTLGRVRPGYRANLLSLDGELNVVDSIIDGNPERFG